MVTWWSTLAVLHAGLAAPAVAQQAGPRDEQVLHDALVVAVAMGIPGLSVAIGVGDSVVWAGAAGYGDLTRRTPVQVNDRFGVGSVTKTFVARVVLQLAEEGKLDLDKTPQDYLDLEIVRAIPNTGTATIRQLLNHQSGIPDWEFQEDWIRKARGDRMELGHVFGKAETLEYCTGDLLPATNAPGERFSYSSTNYTLLGLIIEAVTGNDAEAEIRSRILEPLGLRNTFMESFEDIPGGYVHSYHYATPQFRREAGIHRTFPEIRPYLIETTSANLSAEWTAGGMVSSASDLVRWVQELRDGKLLSPQTHRDALTHFPPREPRTSGLQYLQGIGRTENFFRGATRLGHSGGVLGFSAAMYWLEGTDVAVALLANVGRMHTEVENPIAGLFLREVWLPAVMRYLGR
jgi:D-alanyl-D-alanine carboxypeptidase